MSGSSSKVTFEVQILQSGRWEVHASYPGDQQGQAIKDAKALENISTVSSVKVVREEVDGNSGASKENNIFASANLPDDQQPQGAIEAKKTKATGGSTPVKKKTPAKKATPKKAPIKQSTSMKAGATIPDAIESFDPEEEESTGFSILGLLIKLLLVIMFSAIIASLLTGLAGVWLRDSSFRANTQSNILFGLFVGSFAISIFSMGMSFLSKAKLKAIRKPKPAKPASAPKPSRFKPIKPAKIKKKDPLPASFRDDAEKAAQKNKEETEAAEESEPETAVEEEKPVEEDVKDDQDADPDSEIGVDIDEGVNAPWVKKQQKFIMDYLLLALEESGVDKTKLDNFNKFGVNLFIAGACETLSQEHNLDGKTVALVISEPVKYMGFKRRDAESFADRIQGYLLADSKYMQAYQAGRSAMKSHLDEDPEATKFLKQALLDWNKPKEKGESSGPVTVLFTDIAGSTNMTQTLGDAVAQQVVRAHNRIVREALAKFNGKEIKHTGDGIMASFATTSNGVDAAADMQFGTIKHNANNPDLLLGLKIGLNAGEPIAEDNDLFGTTVQMAARIVDKAQASQIFVSDIVHGICSGKNYTFVKRGPFEMKGFEGGLHLHELIWNQDAAVPEPDPLPTLEPEATPTPEPEQEPEAATEQADEGVEIGANDGAGLTMQEEEDTALPSGGEPDSPPPAAPEQPETSQAPPAPQPDASETVPPSVASVPEPAEQPAPVPELSPTAPSDNVSGKETNT